MSNWLSINNVVSMDLRDNVAIVLIDNPPVNLFNRSVRQGLQIAFAAARSDPRADAVVLHCAGATFSAGADLSDLGGSMPASPDPNDVIGAIEELDKPVVAAIHGSALGGGFELAMGCHYRIALHGTTVGLPQVCVGLLPGTGGTQRLPRLVGVADALEITVSGTPLSASEALDKGAIDALVEGDPLCWAVAYAKRLVADRSPLKRTSATRIASDSYPASIFADFRKRITHESAYPIAAMRIIDCIEVAATHAFIGGLAFERARFLECLGTLESAAMRHLLFAEYEARQLR